MSEKPLHFNDHFSNNVSLSLNGYCCRRVVMSKKSRVFSNRPVFPQEVVSFKINEVSAGWRGAFQVGIVYDHPETYLNPRGPVTMRNKKNSTELTNTIKESLCRSKNVFTFVIEKTGVMLFAVNSVDNLNVFLTGIDVTRQIWLMIEINGVVKSLEFQENMQNSAEGSEEKILPNVVSIKYCGEFPDLDNLDISGKPEEKLTDEKVSTENKFYDEEPTAEIGKGNNNNNSPRSNQQLEEEEDEVGFENDNRREFENKFNEFCEMEKMKKFTAGAASASSSFSEELTDKRSFSEELTNKREGGNLLFNNDWNEEETSIDSTTSSGNNSFYSGSTSKFCPICLEKEKNAFFIPCYDQCTCYECAMKVWKLTRKCPKCLKDAKKVEKIFLC